MKKLIAPVVLTLLAALGVFIALQGGPAAIVLGSLLVLVSVLFLVGVIIIMRDPQGTVERLVSRRAQLEMQAGRTPASGDLPAEPAAPAEPTHLNRAERRAARNKR